VINIEKQTKKDFIEKSLVAEGLIGQMPGALFGNDCTKLEHFFGDGMYIREMKAPKGQLNVSKLHKTNHPFFILKGEVTVGTEDGPVRYKAPMWGMTKAGTKRVVFFHEDTTWITVHATKETDLKKIEDEVIAKTYDELPTKIKEQLCLG
jgi:hypothetical protein